MKPELKLGRRVIAWDSIDNKTKGFFICNDGDDENPYAVYNPEKKGIDWFNNVQIDPTYEPMNGDEVEVSDTGKHWYYKPFYVGQEKDGRHCVNDKNGDFDLWKYVRFPQQSKRDRIKEAIRSWQESSNVPMYDDLADQIDKIYTEES